MKKIFKQMRIPLAIALFFFAAGLVSAADCSDMVKCAVCGKEMKKADAKITHVYKEKTYYFASEKCKEAFVKEPEKFLQAKCCMKDMACCPGCGKGMKKADAKIAHEYKGQTYNFCCEKCKEAFVKEPEKFLKTVYACPMHAEEKADKPGKCPKCGMDMKEKTMACGMMMGGCCPMMKGHMSGKGKGCCPMMKEHMSGKGMGCCPMMKGHMSGKGMGGCCHMMMKGCGAKHEVGKMKDCGKKEECEKACDTKAKAGTVAEKKEQN